VGLYVEEIGLNSFHKETPMSGSNAKTKPLFFWWHVFYFQYFLIPFLGGGKANILW